MTGVKEVLCSVSKPSAVEKRYFDQLAAYLRDNWVLCPIYPKLRAVERSHPRGVGFWETGGALKGHHFFAETNLLTVP
jgi:hypothetical protein